MLTVMVLLSVVIDKLYAYDDQDTHPRVTGKAVGMSALNKYLKNNFGFADGSETIINGQPIIKLLRIGSTAEDNPMCRATNHFHNPLLPWDQSQLKDDAGITGGAIGWYCTNIEKWLPANRKSAITWATGLTSNVGLPVKRINQDMGWDDARRYFYSGLTAESNADRETNFPKTFQAVGQVLHLLHDMAVPAHVRNDIEARLNYIQEAISLRFIVSSLFLRS